MSQRILQQVRKGQTVSARERATELGQGQLRVARAHPGVAAQEERREALQIADGAAVTPRREERARGVGERQLPALQRPPLEAAGAVQGDELDCVQ